MIGADPKECSKLKIVEYAGRKAKGAGRNSVTAQYDDVRASPEHPWTPFYSRQTEAHAYFVHKVETNSLSLRMNLTRVGMYLHTDEQVADNLIVTGEIEAGYSM